MGLHLKSVIKANVVMFKQTQEYLQFHIKLINRFVCSLVMMAIMQIMESISVDLVQTIVWHAPIKVHIVWVANQTSSSLIIYVSPVVKGVIRIMLIGNVLVVVIMDTQLMKIIFRRVLAHVEIIIQIKNIHFNNIVCQHLLNQGHTVLNMLVLVVIVVAYHVMALVQTIARVVAREHIYMVQLVEQDVVITITIPLQILVHIHVPKNPSIMDHTATIHAPQANTNMIFIVMTISPMVLYANR